MFLIVLAALVAWLVFATQSPHDGRLEAVSFFAGVIVARVGPPLWRWADRDDV
jgi:hypothetical protein